jgi:uncharacterized protein
MEQSYLHNSHNRTLFSSLTYIFILSLILLFVPTSVFAFDISSQTQTQRQSLVIQETTLLAVSELENGSLSGGLARLKLEIIPGTGRVFFDTYPLTKIDTQVSTRSAKSYACDFLEIDCSGVDFIYTIDSGSSLIGGPSAGASMTVLTIALLDGQNVRRDVALTGTMNSGGFIGVVGGVKEKIEAAYKGGIKTVLIPAGERYYVEPRQVLEIVTIIDTNITNSSPSTNTQTPLETLIQSPERLDLVAYGASLGVEVIEVSHVYDALPYVVDKEYPLLDSQIILPDYYKTTMKALAESLCVNTEQLQQNLDVEVTISNTTFFITNLELIQIGSLMTLPNSSLSINATYETAKRQYASAEQAMQAEQYYSAASYCYSAGLNYHFLDTLDTDVSILAQTAHESLAEWEPLAKYKTITDLQTYMLVEERLKQAREHALAGDELLSIGREYQARFQYISAIERVSSAKAWSTFAQGFGTEFNFGSMRESCQLKLQEANERHTYLLQYTTLTGRIKDNLDKASEYQQSANYELCLHQAALVKAEIDVILSTAGIADSELNTTVTKRLSVVKQTILRQIEKGNFPLVGYSYYEYADSLSQTDPASSLLYLQYALELSSLDIYFDAKRRNGSITSSGIVGSTGIYDSDVYQNLVSLKGTDSQLDFLKGLTLGIILTAIFLFASRRQLFAKLS